MHYCPGGAVHGCLGGAVYGCPGGAVHGYPGGAVHGCPGRAACQRMNEPDGTHCCLTVQRLGALAGLSVSTLPGEGVTAPGTGGPGQCPQRCERPS